jgi:hypothetical protein
MATLSAISFAQANYGKYSMQHSTSEADLQQYIGQHVKLMPYNGFSLYSNNGHDEYIFKSKLGGTVGTIYKVEKIKVGKQIIFELSDPSGKKIKAKVNADRANNYKGMQTCRSFFLVDKFNADKQAMIGKGFNNSEGQQVAKVVDMKMFTIKDNYPQPYLVVQSDLDGSKVLCTEEKAKEVFLPLGSVISSPKVKLSFKVVGIKEDEKNILTTSYPIYNVKCIEDPSIVRSGTISKPESTIFKEDLSGHYISVLSKVEKPSNPSIRYGKTTTVEDKNITKYSYVDNVIDILIFGGSKQFDFILKNVSDNSIKVVWNEAVFVGFDGATSKVMHAGTKYSQREADQPATTIIKGAKIEDLAAPNCNIRYSDVLKEWVTESMYPSAPALSPGQLRLMLPIQIKEVINEYIFIFDVSYVYNHPERLNL